MNSHLVSSHPIHTLSPRLVSLPRDPIRPTCFCPTSWLTAKPFACDAKLCLLSPGTLVQEARWTPGTLSVLTHYPHCSGNLTSVVGKFQSLPGFPRPHPEPNHKFPLSSYCLAYLNILVCCSFSNTALQERDGRQQLLLPPETQQYLILLLLL